MILSVSYGLDKDDNFIYKNTIVDGDIYFLVHWQEFGQIQKDLYELSERQMQIEILREALEVQSDVTEAYKKKYFKIGIVTGTAITFTLSVAGIILVSSIK